MTIFLEFENLRPLKWKMPLPDFFSPGADSGLVGRGRMSDALLVPMLLIGGCGYEDLRLLRSSVGFDRLFDLINDTQRLEGQDNYPHAEHGIFL